jgi:WD40 repeat protein
LKSAESTYRVTCHEVVNHFSFHPNGSLIVTGSLDGSWSLHDVNAGRVLVKIKEQSPVTVIEFHPDGLVLAVGLASGAVNIYDIRTPEERAM